MKILLMTGPLYPLPGNNANLIVKLIPHFLSAGHEVCCRLDGSCQYVNFEKDRILYDYCRST